MKISCVIITHNRVELLKRAVESVLSQTYKDIELWVVDDASEDSTPDYGKQIERVGVGYIRIPKNESKGGNHARNLGIHCSTGEYVAFLDDDDYWLPDKIEKQVRYAEKHPDVGMIYGGTKQEFDNPIYNYCVLPKANYQGDLVKKELVISPFASTITLMVKRSLLLAIGGFDENMRYWQEYELELRIMQKTKVGFVPEVLAVVNRERNVKRLTSQFEGWESSVQYMTRKHQQLFDSLSNDMAKKRNEYYYREAASRSASVGNIDKMKEYYRKANEICPKIEYKIRIATGLTRDNTLFLESLLRKIIYIKDKRYYKKHGTIESD